MTILLIALCISLLLGQFGGVDIIPGVRVFLHDVVVFFIISLFFLRTIRRNSLSSIKGKLIRPMTYFVSAACVSLLLNIGGFSHVQLFLGSLYLWRFLLYFGLYIVVVNDHISPILWRRSVYLVGVAFAILGIIQYLFFPSLRSLLNQGWDEHYYRLFSTFLDPNFAGLFLVVSFFLGLSYASKKPSFTWFIMQSILLVSIVLTHSRSSFVAFVGGLVVFVLCTRKFSLLGILVFAGIIYALIPSYGVDTNRLLRSDSTLARIESYTKSVAAARIAPIFGIGYNMLRFQAARERMLDADGIISRDAGGLNSSLMVVFVTTGIVGFSLFLYLLFHVVRIVLSIQGIIASAIVSSLVAILLHSVFNNSMLYPWILLWVWIIVGSIEKQASKR